MGYLTIQSRKPNHAIIYSNLLADTADSDDELTSFLPGDFVKVSIDVSNKMARLLIRKPLAGVAINKPSFIPLKKGKSKESKLEHYEVEIDFRVISRSHSIRRDWTTAYKTGFRSSGTTVWIEALSDEGEKLFLRLKKKFDEELHSILFSNPTIEKMGETIIKKEISTRRTRDEGKMGKGSEDSNG